MLCSHGMRGLDRDAAAASVVSWVVEGSAVVVLRVAAVQLFWEMHRYLFCHEQMHRGGKKLLIVGVRCRDSAQWIVRIIPSQKW